MDAAVMFRVANGVAIVGWLMMAVAPRWVGTKWVVHRGLLPMGLALLYAVILVATWGQARGDFQTLAGVRSLFQNEWVMVAGWVHYLAFDMFVGSWILRDSWGRGIPHLAMLPLLFLTLMFGPVGYLLYMIVASLRPLRDEETVED